MPARGAPPEGLGLAFGVADKGAASALADAAEGAALAAAREALETLAVFLGCVLGAAFAFAVVGDAAGLAFALGLGEALVLGEALLRAGAMTRDRKGNLRSRWTLSTN